MRKYSKRLVAGLVVLAFMVPLVFGYFHGKTLAVLAPKGQIAVKEKGLMELTVTLGLLVIIPVFILMFSFAWRYREGNTKAKYSPHLTGNLVAETVWWAIPIAIIGVLAVVAWNTSHSLDPHRPIASNGPAMPIQVVALDWKWLFIYPQQHVASVNYLQLPVGQPVTFTITADAPMNSFWIPQLGGQIYAMAGMTTQLNLVADHAGNYRGSSANLSGKGFAGMRFVARADTEQAFTKWVATARQSATTLDLAGYNQLAKPSENNPVHVYASVDPQLFNTIMLKYMGPERS